MAGPISDCDGRGINTRASAGQSVGTRERGGHGMIDRADHGRVSSVGGPDLCMVNGQRGGTCVLTIGGGCLSLRGETPAAQSQLTGHGSG